MDALIPADQDPGARDAGAVLYIDRQLTRKYKRHQQTYRDALQAIDQLGPAPFASLDFDARTRLLQQLESGQVPARLFPGGGKAVFELVLAHTMQGFYGNPRHGGNRDYASWRMMGVPPMPVRGRNLYDLSGEGLAAGPRRKTWRSRG